MAVPVGQTAFITGEVAPAVWGRIDVAGERIAASTMRNMFVDYRGGSRSRAGTKFVGFSKQTGRSWPPRLIPFQFSIKEGLALEFGDFYMRVISNGAFVTDPPVSIVAATKSNPCVISIAPSGALTATPNVSAVTFPYAPGDLVTLAGGVTTSPAILEVVDSQLVSILVNTPGTGYTVADTIDLAGGTFSVDAVVTVATVVSVKATGYITFADNPANGDTIDLDGTTWTFVTTLSGANQTVIQASLAATLGQLTIDLNASADANVSQATYSANTTQLFVEFDVAGTGGNAFTLAASVAIVSGATLTGGSVDGLGSVTVTTPGVFTALPSDYTMTQSATSGGGSGADFQTAVFAPLTMSVDTPGGYTTVPPNPVAQASTTGIGRGATFTMTWGAVPAFANGDWIQINDVLGMTELNGGTYIVAGVTPTSAQLLDVYGNGINSTGYGTYNGGGVAAKIFEQVTPYAEEDLSWLKITQSADVMTICCVNVDTGVEYEPQNLTRSGNTSWAFSDVVDPAGTYPTGLAVDINKGNNVYYTYQVTSIDPETGAESSPSDAAQGEGGVYEFEKDIQIKLTWNPVDDVNIYNIYKTQYSYFEPVPGGELFGLVGQSYGPQWIDHNSIPDFAHTPPRHQNPFARGQALFVNIVTPGNNYTTATATINTSTGSGARMQVIIQNRTIAGVIFYDYGQDYADGDTITITGDGTGATATLVVGPETGTYPSVAAYFQQRRVFANTLNNPDTYWMSQPGAFGNFDTRLPTIATDAITGSPWSVQVNGIQWMITTSGGLLVMTGLAAWILVGSGSFATNVQPISPDTQDANPQPFTGVSPKVPPLKINFDILYVTAKGSLYYDLPYQLYALSEPLDLTAFSTQLFDGFDVIEHCWCEHPNKVLWSVRSDGALLSDTFLKKENVNGWARHDTNGDFVSTCSVTEPPVDAAYFAVKRYPGSEEAYMIERMDDRLWSTPEDVWAVDCGLRLPQPTPNATLRASSATGTGAISGYSALVGGSGYSAATTLEIQDQDHNGSGAMATATIVGGVITAIAITAPGSGYTRPILVVRDPAGSAGGSGASATLTLATSVVFTSSSPVFASGDVGKVIRMGGGIGQITTFTNSSSVIARLIEPITDVRPNSGGIVNPQRSGTWTMTAPTTTVSGLLHLAGMTVTGLADGNVVSPRTVSSTGVVTLDEPASSVVIGLGFTAQLQSVYGEEGQPTAQGMRKKVAAVNMLLESSRGAEFGSNQIDGSSLSPPEIAPEWVNMTSVLDPQFAPKAPYNATTPGLKTGWYRAPVTGGYRQNGQAAVQQRYPLPLNVLALVAEYLPGDNADVAINPRGGQG
ncbi:MAG: hypothetical protein E6R03_08720 [Hyphomicrobiaceae bacterium]|nr:MAG: hypothetical protein E6R03_08720 [Hyphomicrobiaceae bacterium]